MRLLVLALLLPGLAWAAPPKPAEGPLAEAVRRGIASGRGRFDHARWDALLRRHVDALGRVDYVSLGGERGELDAYLGAVARADVGSLPRNELLALLVNAYNACTVRLILDAARTGELPASIRDLPEPWARNTCTLGGETVSLDTIEHGVLRALFRDPRIHAAVNCASKSCPELAPWAFQGAAIERQLDERMTAMVSSEVHVRVRGGGLAVSRLFDWYGSDFAGKDALGGGAPSLVAYLARYAQPSVRARFEALGASPRVDFLDYDWSLNGR